MLTAILLILLQLTLYFSGKPEWAYVRKFKFKLKELRQKFYGSRECFSVLIILKNFQNSDFHVLLEKLLINVWGETEESRVEASIVGDTEVDVLLITL